MIYICSIFVHTWKCVWETSMSRLKRFVYSCNNISACTCSDFCFPILFASYKMHPAALLCYLSTATHVELTFCHSMEQENDWCQRLHQNGSRVQQMSSSLYAIHLSSERKNGWKKKKIWREILGKITECNID